MKFSIFHTSHCGSTLLATLLKDSIEAYCEPEWTRSLYMDNIYSAKDNTLVKYPSFQSMACRILSGKKIFLFRKIKDHLEKITQKKHIVDRHLNQYYPICLGRNLFPNIEVDNDLKKLAFIWAHRYLDAYFSQEVLTIDANDFFLEPEKIVNQVTKFCNIKSVENFDALNFYVKKDYNHTETTLSKVQPSIKKEFNVKDGYVNSNNFIDIEKWVYNDIFGTIKTNHIFPLLRDKNNKAIYDFQPIITLKKAYSNLS